MDAPFGGTAPLPKIIEFVLGSYVYPFTGSLCAVAPFTFTVSVGGSA